MYYTTPGFFFNHVSNALPFACPAAPTPLTWPIYSLLLTRATRVTPLRFDNGELSPLEEQVTSDIAIVVADSASWWTPRQRRLFTADLNTSYRGCFDQKFIDPAFIAQNLCAPPLSFSPAYNRTLCNVPDGLKVLSLHKNLSTAESAMLQSRLALVPRSRV